MKITDDLCAYLDGLKYAIRQLKEQLSAKEKAEREAGRRREEEEQKLWKEVFEDPVSKLEPSEQSDKENGQ